MPMSPFIMSRARVRVRVTNIFLISTILGGRAWAWMELQVVDGFGVAASGV